MSEEAARELAAPAEVRAIAEPAADLTATSDTDAALDVDVAIVGGGPAGAAAALTLLRYTGRRVAVIERSAFDAPRIGESTSSSIHALLGFVGAAHVLDATAGPACAAAAAWGNATPVVRHAVFTGQGAGFLLDRRAFDAALCDEIAARGGRVVRAGLRRAVRRDARLELVCDGAVVRCRFAIDASGRGAGLARQLGARIHRDDALVGVALRCAPGAPGASMAAADAAATLVEATPDGWWYTAPVPDGALVAVFMTDAPLVRALGLTTAAGAARALDAAPLTRARLAGRTIGPPRVASACSQRLACAAGLGWIAAGDAAAAFDPLASMGIGHALWSGSQAARAVEDALLGSSQLADGYARAIRQHHDHTLALRWRYYALERRWPDRPFWRRGADAAG